MDKKEQILHYHRVDGLSLREIARRTGLNRKTVTRYIREYEAMMQSDPEEGIGLCLASKLDNLNIEFAEMTGFDFNEATNVFVKVNSGGTVLEMSDILNSIIVSTWKHVNETRFFL